MSRTYGDWGDSGVARLFRRSYRFVIIATENTENAEMINGNVPLLRSLHPFPLIAVLMAN
jgi:hypothetical protein